MKISQSSKLYFGRKGITDTVPLLEPGPKLNVGSVVTKMKKDQYSDVYRLGESASPPDCGSSKDYTWTPTYFDNSTENSDNSTPF